MNQPHQQIVIVSVIAILVYLWTGVRVAGARRKFGIMAPAISGNSEFERYVRVQTNTLEWLPVFLAGLWMASLYWSQIIVALIGLAWSIGRIAYALAYTAAPEKRAPGFGIQALATFALLIMSVIGALQTMAVTGGV